MNICLIGDFSNDLDEGYKNISYYLASGLEKRNVVTRFNIKEFRTVGFWNGISHSHIQIIHTIAQPTDLSLIFTKVFKLRWLGSRSVVSALRPEAYFNKGKTLTKNNLLFKLVKPDIILVQSGESEAFFRDLGCQTRQLPNGVDLERFRPTSISRKKELLRKYGLDPHRPLVLHVGHLQAARNLMMLKPLIDEGIQIVVAGSLYMGTNQLLIEQLETAGFFLLKGYQPNIEELYMLADCYVFPVEPGISLSMPLSVLEAMACNLPVVTTRFPGLVDAFAEGAGFKFADSPEELLNKIRETLHTPAQPSTRRIVEKYSWEAVVEQLEGYYQELISK